MTTQKPNLVASTPQPDAVPHAYVIIKRSQLCRCGTLHEWSETYSKTHLKSRLGAGKYITNLRPIHKPEDILYNLPIEITIWAGTRTLICHECADPTSLIHLPPAPVEDDRRITGGPGNPTPPKAAKSQPSRKPTIDDL